MTKKTNSLLLRYGISTFWRNKSSDHKVTFNIIQLENLIYKELFTKNFNVLATWYQASNVHIVVYNFSQFNNFLKQQLIKYYRKVFCLSKVITKFGICERYITWILHSEGISKIGISDNNTVLNNSALLKRLFFNRWILFKLFLFLFVLKTSKYNKNLIILFFLMHKKNLNYLQCLSNVKLYFAELRKVNQARRVYKKVGKFGCRKGFSPVILRVNKNLRRSQGLLALKLLSIKLENSMFWTCNQRLKVDITHIFLNSGLFLRYRFNNFFEKSNFRFLLYTLLLATYYNNSKLIGDFIASEVEKNKNHFRVLTLFIKSFENLFFTKTLKFKGFQLRLTGKLGGKMRKSKYHYKLGKVELQTLKSSLSYSLCLSYTKFGVISVKTWLLNAS